MRVVRIYTGDDNESHFEDLNVPLEAARYGRHSRPFAAKSVIFRETAPDAMIDFHNPPERQMVITLAGIGELECGDGSKRRFGPGDILLAEDTTGHGHITREIEGPRQGIFIRLDEIEKMSERLRKAALQE